MLQLQFLLYVLLPCAFAFPGLSNLACPYAKDASRPTHNLQKRSAAPFDPEFPYTDARYNGLPGAQLPSCIFSLMLVLILMLQEMGPVIFWSLHMATQVESMLLG